jgi:lipoprotein-releasing system permease protein
VPRIKRFAVEGIYRSGLPEQELQVGFASATSVYSFVRQANVVSQWELSLASFESAGRVASGLREALPGFAVQDWGQLNAHLFASLKLERFAMFVVLAFIVVVASFNIVTTLTLMVLEKKKEIAILRAMGAKESQVAAIFLGEGLMIGALGVVGGVALGFLLCVLLRRYEFIQLPEIYYDRTLPVTFDGRYYAGIALAAWVIVLGACVYPSRRAARLPPIEGIRYG